MVFDGEREGDAEFDGFDLNLAQLIRGQAAPRGPSFSCGSGALYGGDGGADPDLTREIADLHIVKLRK